VTVAASCVSHPDQCPVFPTKVGVARVGKPEPHKTVHGAPISGRGQCAAARRYRIHLPERSALLVDDVIWTDGNPRRDVRVHATEANRDAGPPRAYHRVGIYEVSGAGLLGVELSQVRFRDDMSRTRQCKATSAQFAHGCQVTNPEKLLRTFGA